MLNFFKRIFKRKTENSPERVGDEDAGLAYAVDLLRHYESDSKRKGVAIVILAAVALLEGVVISNLSIQKKPEDKYFAVNEQMQIIPMRASDRPTLSETQVINQGARAITELFSYSYANYEENMTRLGEQFFTQEAIGAIDAQFRGSSGVYQMVQANKLISKILITGAGFVVERGTIDNGRAWEISYPVVLTYENQTKSSSNRAKVNVLIVEAPNSPTKNQLRVRKILMTTVGR